MNTKWRQLAEENGLDCTLRKVEIKCVREHEPVPGDDFMPYGWCGACEHCAAYPNPDVCEKCSYNDRYDLRQPVYWPCVEEIQRQNAENYARFREELRKKHEYKLQHMGYGESR